MNDLLPRPPDPDPGPASNRFKDRFLHMLGRDDPPESVAAAFAVGVAISFTPLIGFHWMMALALAILLRLNKVDVFLGTLVVNPLTLGPTSVVAVWLGRAVLFAKHEAEAHPPLRELFTRDFWDGGVPAMKTLGLQWATGMFVLTGLAGALTYVGLRWLLRRRADGKRGNPASVASRGNPAASRLEAGSPAPPPTPSR